MSLYMISNKTRNAVKDHFGSYIKKTSIDADVEENTTDFSVREDNGDAASNETYLASSVGMTATRALDDTDRRVVYLGREIMREGKRCVSCSCAHLDSLMDLRILLLYFVCRKTR